MFCRSVARALGFGEWSTDHVKSLCCGRRRRRGRGTGDAGAGTRDRGAGELVACPLPWGPCSGAPSPRAPGPASAWPVVRRGAGCGLRQRCHVGCSATVQDPGRPGPLTLPMSPILMILPASVSRTFLCRQHPAWPRVHDGLRGCASRTAGCFVKGTWLLHFGSPLLQFRAVKRCCFHMLGKSKVRSRDISIYPAAPSPPASR